MLRVNVGMSRKLSRDYNSTAFSVNLEGEIGVQVDQPEVVLEKIREYYDLADEALRVQIERYESDSAIASRDEEPRKPLPSAPRIAQTGHGNGQDRCNGHVAQPATPEPAQQPRQPQNGNGHQGELATNKQIQFLLNLSKQKRMTKQQLQEHIAATLGYDCDIYELSKRDAGIVLDRLTNGNGSRARSRT
ncbi:MAG: hypothetical protein ACUVQG_06750 [Thermogutta sp.]